ncbi:MAG: CHAT domain-containing protein [Caldilineaceae bacterium]
MACAAPPAARAIGQRLFDALIVGGVRDAYSSSLLRARERGMGLRLRLRIEAPEVAVLPWEFLFDAQEGDHVCLLRETPLTRYVALARDRDVLTVKPPLRILGMVADPTDLPRLDVRAEQARIAHALEHRLERGDVELHWVADGTWRALQAALEQGPWHVFHFVGHGNFDPLTSEGRLAFCDAAGKLHSMSATQLGRLFSGHATLRLAFLNACEGGRTGDAELFSSVGAVLTRRGIPAVISMQFDISDRAALEFARLFYDALARGNPVDVAVTAARSGLSFADPHSTEWATPMLHMRAPDGRLFAVDASAAIFDETKPIPRPAVYGFATPPPANPPPATRLAWTFCAAKCSNSGSMAYWSSRSFGRRSTIWVWR